MAIKLHTCPNTWIHGPHPCWQVMKALNDAGIPFEQVKEPTFRGKRDALFEATGQRLLPVLEYSDGHMHREESKDVIARIKAGEIGDHAH